MTRILFLALALLTAGTPVTATTVEWQIQQTLTLKEALWTWSCHPMADISMS